MPRNQHGRAGGRPWQRRRDAFIRDPRHTHCAWCGHLVDKTLPGTHPLGPTANHRHLLALGGDELRGDLDLMHMRCNVQHMHVTMRAARDRGHTPAPAPARRTQPQRELAPRTSRTW